MDPRVVRSRAAFVQLVEQAQGQHCVFSGRQAAEIGVGYQSLYRAVAAGKLLKELPGTYRLAGSKESWESRLMAACLWLDRSDAVVSHLAAAALWSLPGFERGPIELTTARWKKPLPPIVVHKSCGDLAGHTTIVGCIPVTNPGMTLVDVAGLVSPTVLEIAFEDSLRRRLTSIAHLKWLCQGRQGKAAKGIAVLRSLLGDNHVPTESAFETQLLQAIRRAGLPPPERQYQVHSNNEFIARVDFAYPWAKVAIEADSYRFHSGRESWESNLDRRNKLTSLGWLVIHVTHRQMNSSMDELVRRIVDALTPKMGG